MSGRGLSLRGGGEALRSESDSDTGRRGREALEECREVVQLGPTGEDWGFGRVDIPERDLQKDQTNTLLDNIVIMLCLLLETPGSSVLFTQFQMCSDSRAEEC